ncbi:ABC transporter substrate-binding protein [Shewanella intestini]|uniref:Iron-siderophore ABC transporter substrate-binding protein n=1 Tax=Shewanella intestini TaxID=2017544 RepID=A0ABS5I064_9GAMM|nr:MULTISPECIES: iron-siderophore ABC transporter substrate-binding protein [Shewanella]MBR9727417.1 iron-siderophore ABC transporter substrate-binding protein [Shewanella intestini]MRG35533.1 ABC transporter substrate-binding protein [Shewanella sp. XMDDZSB0408]
MLLNNKFKMMARLLTLLCSVFLSQASVAKTVTDSRGEHTLAATPTRIVALNWDLAEQLLDVGITPVGVANPTDYRTWVVHPTMPDSVANVGTRMEPSLAEIAALKPDLILAASPQKDLLARLQRIAPVLYYDTYNSHESAANAAINNFRLIADVVDKSSVAEQKIAHMQQRFVTLKQQLSVAYPQLPQVVALRFANENSVFIYGKNSTTEYAMTQLGLRLAMPQPGSRWGIVQKRVIDLAKIDQGYVLYFKPHYYQQQLDASILWQAMPFIKNGHIHSVEPVWNYGGAMSILRIAEQITASLLKIAPNEQN